MAGGIQNLSNIFFALVLLFSSQALQAAGSKGPTDAAANTVPTGNMAQADQLFRSFSAFCPSQGEWTQLARNSAKNMADMLISIKDDPACKSLAGSLESLNTLQIALDKETITQDEITWNQNRRSRYELLVQLDQAQAAGDIALVSSYESSLRTIQLEMGNLEEATYRRNQNLKKLLIAQQSVSALKLIMNQAQAQQECFSKRPELFSSLISLSTSIGAMALTGGLGLGVAAGAELVGSAVEFARKNKLQKQVNAISEGSIHSTFACVLEAMSNQWCAAKEAEDMHYLRMRSLGKEGHFYNGVRYLQREVPILLKWLDKVKSGAKAQNSDEATRQMVVAAKQAALTAFRIRAIATLKQAEDLLPPNDTAENKKIRFQSLKNVIESISNQVQSGGAAVDVSSSNPIADIVAYEDIPWILAGLSEAPNYENADKELVTKNFSSTPAIVYIEKREPWAEDIGYPFDPRKIEIQIEALYERGDRRLSEERAHRLQVDPRGVLFEAEVPETTGIRRGTSPLQALDSIVKFLDEVDLDSMSANQRKVYQNTRDRLSKIKEIVQEAVTAADGRLIGIGEGDDDGNGEVDPFPPSTPDDAVAAEALNRVYKEALLQYGNAFLSDRLRRIIRYELYSRVVKPGNVELDKTTSAQLLASQDIAEELEAFNSISPTTTIDDISGSYGMFRTSTQAFAVTFAEYLSKSIRYHYREATIDKGSRPAFEKMCLLLLSVPDFKEVHLMKILGDDLKLCDGVQKPSILPEFGKPSYKITYQSYFESWEDRRACHYRNFVRSENILKQFGPQNGPKVRNRALNAINGN